jgi:hypothetical protein
MLRKLPKQALEMGRLLLKLPKAMEQLITRIETGQIEVRLAPDMPGNGRSRRGRRNGNNHRESSSTLGAVSLVLLFAISLAGGSLLMAYAHLAIPGWFFLGLSGLTGLRLVFKR